MVQFPVGDVVALAQAVELANVDRVTLGNRARQTAVDKLGVEPFARRLVALLIEAARASKRSTGKDPASRCADAGLEVTSRGPTRCSWLRRCRWRPLARWTASLLEEAGRRRWGAA